MGFNHEIWTYSKDTRYSSGFTKPGLGVFNVVELPKA
jgi:hypothetical protein